MGINDSRNIVEKEIFRSITVENLVQYLLDEGTVWLPRMIGVVAILITFYVISKVLKRIIITAAGRLELDQNLIALFARVSSVMVMIFGFVTALGTVGVDVSALVAGLGDDLGYLAKLP